MTRYCIPQLVWFHRTTVLALQDMVVAKNGRVSVRSHANTTFYLTVHDIREEDRGNYMCQVNTVPMRSQIGHLEVNGTVSCFGLSSSSAHYVHSATNFFGAVHQLRRRHSRRVTGQPSVQCQGKTYTRDFLASRRWKCDQSGTTQQIVSRQT